MSVPTWFRSHSLIILLSAAAVCTFAWLYAQRGRLRAEWPALVLVSLLHVVYGVAAVRLFAALEGAAAGSMSLFGAVFLMPVAYALGTLVTKRPMAEMFDLFTVPLLITLFLARVNCLVSGCCLGAEIPFWPGMRWPIRVAELIYYAVFLEIFAPRIHKDRTRGEVYPLYMLTYGVFRFITQFARAEYTLVGPLHLSHWWALASVLIGALALWRVRAHTKTKH